ncbi:MAG: zf-TFIIB domain-containing protein [Pseudomonadota bacterium]
MNCPIDGETLVIADRSGVEIDYCPKCRGVWLDRGELDKIIERVSPAIPHSRSDRDRDNRRREPEERESIFSELFDFF